MNASETSQNSKAILWVLLGTALFTIVYASGKLGEGTASPFQIIFVRYISGFLTLLMVTARTGHGFANYRSKKPAMHFIRAIMGCYGGAAIVYSSANMPILDATAISLLYVIFIVALGLIILKETVSKSQWVAIFVSSIGALVVMSARGAFQNFDIAYLWPATIALAGALMIALEAILIRTLSRSEKSLTVLLYVNFFGIFLVAIPALRAWQPLDFTELLLIVSLGPIAITAQYCTIRGYRTAEVSILGPIDYTWLIFAGLLGILFFDEIPTPGVLSGAALIALGGIMLAVPKSK